MAAITNKEQTINLDNSVNVNLMFYFELNKKVYEDSDWGEPPQFAIWLEEPNSGIIHTVCVSYRTASGDWMGKVECPLSLPYWVSRYNKQTGNKGAPTFRRKLADAITAATPTQSFSVNTKVPCGSCWKYFIEVNAYIQGYF
ncbi:MAG: hypothetical protein JXB29_11660 [Sedimentisphaerales bacterium]|nr:hypothetical protein [Sedimentisphaerales bacterium]